jgi:hypothetical protein
MKTAIVVERDSVEPRILPGAPGALSYQRILAALKRMESVTIRINSRIANHDSISIICGR